MNLRLLARSIPLLTLLLCASQAFPQTNDSFCLAVPLPFPGDTIHLDSERVACIEQLVSSAMADAYKAWKDSIARLVGEKMALHQCYKEPFKEEFTATYTSTEHHYTLYYYDLAGNVIQTIPPEGVHPLSDASFPGGIWNGDEPDHDTLHITRYQYNSVGSLLSQVTPDAGRKHYYYDRAQRLRLSQDAEQKGDNDFAFSRYDGQGRMIETGELSGYTLDIADIADPQFPESGSHTLEESIMTTYDQITPPGTIRSMNARGRIASVSNPYMTSWYDYDPHGNIRTLSHLIPGLQDDTVTLRYRYDIRSGNVSEMLYEPDEPDQFVQRFVYDADNRLQEAWSSDDGYVFDQDARYFYYLHGPLARVEYGEDKVQGQDYYYTLQGWIKGLNMPGAEGPGTEPGRDGYVGGHSNLHRYIAHDTMRYALSYHEDDYVPVAGLSLLSEAVRYSIDGMASDILGPVGEKGFYGGNIAAMLTDNGVGLQGMAYRYDALHRIKYAGNYLWDTDWSAENTLDMPLVNYDANGNILRHSLKSNTDTDHLRYFYKSGKPNTLDYVADGGVVTGIGAQAPDNYMYDEIGNLLYDASESTSLGWDVYNKLRIVTGGPDGTIHYTYDAQGNRMYKAYDDYTDVYVRDAGGNIIAIYKSGEVSGYETDSLREFHMYGSSRLGIHYINKVAATEAPGGPDLLRPRGYRRHKSYELTNHLGNVLTTISDLKQGSDEDMNGIADIYHAGLKSWADYYPFGMEMAGRTGVSGNTSRFGFNGKEKDPSISDLTHYDYGFRLYNPAVGRFLSVDPLTKSYPMLTPYQFASNTPIQAIDLDGLEATSPPGIQFLKDGTPIITSEAIDNARISAHPGFQPVVTSRVRPPLGPSFGVPSELKLRQAQAKMNADILKIVVADPEALKEGDMFEWAGILPFGKFANVSSELLKVVKYSYKHFPKEGIPWEKIVESTLDGPAKFIHGTDYEKLTKKAWDSGTEVTTGKPWKVYQNDEIIGATAGKETKYMRVELTESTGELHSSPISQEQYQKLLKKID